MESGRELTEDEITKNDTSSLPTGGMGHGMKMSMAQEGLPSEQTGLWFASFFPYHILPV